LSIGPDGNVICIWTALILEKIGCAERCASYRASARPCNAPSSRDIETRSQSFSVKHFTKDSGKSNCRIDDSGDTSKGIEARARVVSTQERSVEEASRTRSNPPNCLPVRCRGGRASELLTGKAPRKLSFRLCLPVRDLETKAFEFSGPSAVFGAMACDFESWLHRIEAGAFRSPYR
jgi:hypothetical protein